MSLHIKTNITALNAQRNLAKTTRSLQSSMEKLSSGERINRAADDAAGLAVSENLRADMRSLTVAKRNSSDGISMVQTAEGGLVEISSMLIRLRELSVQAASDTLGDREREFLDKEFLQLKDEIDRIAASTEFNGTRLLVGNNDIGEELLEGANRFPLEIQVGKDHIQSLDAISQRNPLNVIRIDFGKINAFTQGENSLGIGSSEDGTRVNNKVNAQASIATLDQAIFRVNEHRAYLGSLQNRLSSSINNLSVQIENMSEAQSRIRDTDFAAETAEMTQKTILQQAGVSVLSNAKVQPQIALSLLQ